MLFRNISTIYLLDNKKILLIYRVGSRLFIEPIWAGVGGHVEPEEINNPNYCVIRELFEETGIPENNIKNLNLKYITTRKLTDEIRIQYIFFAEPNGEINLVDSKEGKLEWINIDLLSSLKMSFTNEQCLTHYFDKGKNDNNIYTASLYVENNTPQMNFTCLKDFEFTY